MKKDIDRVLGRDSFEYGNHRIAVEVRLCRARERFCDNANERSDYVYARVVNVTASHKGDNEFRNRSYVSLEEDLVPGPIAYLLALVSDKSAREIHSGPPPIPPLPEQIESTARPVFEELDDLYNFTQVDYDIDVTVGVERVKHEMSWVGVEDEIDRISAELDAIVGEPARQGPTSNSE